MKVIMEIVHPDKPPEVINEQSGIKNIVITRTAIRMELNPKHVITVDLPVNGFLHITED